MEQQEIEEGNVDIAKFMELKLDPSYMGLKVWTDGIHGYYQKGLKYDTDWNMLMPVWYKFRDLDFKHPIMANYMAQIANHLAYGEISDVHRVLSNGIKWYNQTSKNSK